MLVPPLLYSTGESAAVRMEEYSAMSLEVNESTITKDSKVDASEESTQVESKEVETETSDESSFASKFMSYAKTCDQCQRMSTSRWRRGPSGPKVKN